MSAHANYSLAKSLALLPADQRQAILNQLSDREAEELHWDWRFWARPEQILPGTARAAIQRKDWTFWVLKAGRGFGKTRTGAEGVREWAENPHERILMIAPTANDLREIMIEGESGLMQCYPTHRRPEYNSSRHLIQFPSGAIGITRSADEPERLRGPQFSKFWGDEFCAWRYAKEAWDQIMFGFRRKGADLQGIITTTPKPTQVFKDLLKDSGSVVTGGSSYANRDNISEKYYQKVIKPYEGTRLGQQEIHAEILEDTPGALWTQKLIDAGRVTQFNSDELVRVVVAIDPAVSVGEESSETGIIAAGLLRNGHVVVLDDESCKQTPHGWAAVAIALFSRRRADRIVGEVNNGGDLVEANVRSFIDQSGRQIGQSIPFRQVRASRGKTVRAEPVAAMYERGHVHHVGSFAELEAQMTTYVPAMDMKSPDRMDALVWAVTELAIAEESGPVMQYGIVGRKVISPI